MVNSSQNSGQIFETLLGTIEAELAALPKPDLLTVSQYIQPADIKNDARREVLNLFKTALTKLNTDAHTGADGHLALAAMHISLRSSSLAETLNVKRPRFELNEDYNLQGSSLHQTIGQIKILFDIARNDVKTSRAELNKALFRAKSRETDKNLKELSKSEQDILLDMADDGTVPPNGIQTVPVHQQMTVMMNKLVSEYETVTDMLAKKLDEITPKGPQTPMTTRKTTGPRKLF